MTGALHGHFCPFLAIGVKAAARAVKELGISSTGMEEVVAIVETNNCFSDGVQFVTGCSLGTTLLSIGIMVKLRSLWSKGMEKQ